VSAERNRSLRTLCVGIDPHPSVLEAWGCADSDAGLASFVSRIVPVLVDSGVRVVKPQVAFFERLGVAGMRQLAVLLGELRALGIVVIGDAKRGDIGSTMSGYADAWLAPGSDFEVDFLTAVPYQGVGALEPALRLAAEHDKGVFVLAATSNPEAGDTQKARRADGMSVAHGVVDDMSKWVLNNPGTQSRFGVVVGATVSLSDFGFDMSDYPGMPILAPGFGYQGAELSQASTLFPDTSPLFAVVARSVLLAGEAGFTDAVRSAEGDLHS
jgi:orotidine-5'-phosphate decarboxylase